MSMLILTVDPRFTGIVRDPSGLGWRRFNGDVALRCRGCGATMTHGYIDTMGRDRRCTKCVIVVEPEDGE